MYVNIKKGIKHTDSKKRSPRVSIRTIQFSLADIYPMFISLLKRGLFHLDGLGPKKNLLDATEEKAAVLPNTFQVWRLGRVVFV